MTEPNEAAIRRWGAIPRSAHEQFGLDPTVAAEAAPGVEASVELPNFLVVCAERAELPGE